MNTFHENDGVFWGGDRGKYSYTVQYVLVLLQLLESHVFKTKISHRLTRDDLLVIHKLTFTNQCCEKNLSAFLNPDVWV